MSSSVLTIRSPSLFTMSQSQLNHTYDTNQKKNTMNIPESKQSILNIPSSSSSSKQRNANHNHNHQNHHNKNNNNSKKNNNGDDHNHTNDNHGGINHNSSSFSTPYNHIQPHSSDKIQLKSTNRSSHHQVSADNWRIRYYMNLNLVKQPQHISLQYRSSSLPTNHMQQHVNSHTPPSKLPSHHDYDRDINDLNLSKLSFDQYENKTRKSIEKKHDDNDSNNDNNHNESSSTSSTSSTSSSSSSKNKLIHIVSKTKSQNNTPPRPIASMLKKHHKKSRLSRIRSRSDGMLSFQANKKSPSRVNSSDSINDDDDNDSVSTTDSVNNHHLNAIHNLTPPRSSKISKINTKITTSRSNKHSHPRPSPNSSLVYQSSRTPPANNYNDINYTTINDNNNNNTKVLSRHNNVQQRKIWSEPVGYHSSKSSSIAIHRSRPMSINKKKSRFDVDFKPSRDHSYQPSSDPLFTNLTNPDSLLDDEANFDME